MKNAILVLTLMLYFTSFSIGQNSIIEQNIQDFSFMQGNWIGTLAYTDYQDDKTQVQLKTTKSYMILDKKLFTQTTYIEPNGVPVYNKGQISVTKKGDKINFNGEMLAVSEKKDGRIVLTGMGQDNDKKSVIRETIEYATDKMTITKAVKYEGSNDFLLRHQYLFQRESTDSIRQRLLATAFGTWELDLRPSPEAQPYLKDFIISSFADGKLSGVFYGNSFTNGKIHVAWGKLYFSFTTADNSGTYFHSGYIDEGRLYGTSYSEARDFMIPWFSTRKKQV